MLDVFGKLKSPEAEAMRERVRALRGVLMESNESGEGRKALLDLGRVR